MSTVSYGSSFFLLRFMARMLRTRAINQGGKTWSVTLNSISKRYIHCAVLENIHNSFKQPMYAPIVIHSKGLGFTQMLSKLEFSNAWDFKPQNRLWMGVWILPEQHIFLNPPPHMHQQISNIYNYFSFALLVLGRLPLKITHKTK